MADATPSVDALVLALDVEGLYGRLGHVRELTVERELAFHRERRLLDEQGALLAGAARRLEEEALPAAPGLERIPPLDQRLAAARTLLEGARLATMAALEQEAATLLAAVEQALAARLNASPPSLRLVVRSLPGQRRILHLDRPPAEHGAVLLLALTGKIPSRHDYLVDDSTDDVLLAPPTLYPSDGVDAADTRPGPRQLAALLAELPGPVWPVKGMIPLLGAPVHRWLVRGPVLEAEIADHDAFRNLLTTDEAEAITARLLELKHRGRLHLELGLED